MASKARLSVHGAVGYLSNAHALWYKLICHGNFHALMATGESLTDV